MKSQKPRKGVESHRVIRKRSDGSFSYEEKRGIRSITLELDPAAVRDGEEKDDASAKAQLLLYAARRFLQKAGEKSLDDIIQEAKSSIENDFTTALNKAFARWVAELKIKYGLFSPIPLAASLLAHSASINTQLINLIVPEEGLEDAAADNAMEEQVALMEQVYHLANAWHWFHMEIFGEHELAFAKMEHAAVLAQGTKTTADKGARRAAIIRSAIEAARESSKVNMAKTSAVAKVIRPAVDAECLRGGLPVSISASSFEKLVYRVMKSDKA